MRFIFTNMGYYTKLLLKRILYIDYIVLAVALRLQRASVEGGHPRGPGPGSSPLAHLWARVRPMGSQGPGPDRKQKIRIVLGKIHIIPGSSI